ncbi:unnamed protein product [Cuscuta campestris]|uniref:RNase H type-1 domain-containing protein n=1 Tax=Cuscuta campestris TaxID=132261 RepID=A0A484KTW3_9ASTE|nr:unnamed protein product [Cuscuta campestris]
MGWSQPIKGTHKERNPMRSLGSPPLSLEGTKTRRKRRRKDRRQEMDGRVCPPVDGLKWRYTPPGKSKAGADVLPNHCYYWAAFSRWSAFFIKKRFPTVTLGKNRSKRNKIAAKARTNLEGKEKLSSEDLRHQITLSQSRRETQDKSGERSFHSKAPKSSHLKDSQGTRRETGQGEDEEVESQGHISVHKRMRKNASQRLGPRTEESGENSGGHGNEDAGDILKLRKELEELKRQVDKDGSFGPTVEIISPFTARVMKAQLPRGMKAPEIRYKGVTDPNDHLATYQTHMLMHAVEDEIQCRLFVGTLEGPAVKWFLTLPNGTIDCFKDIAQLFLNAYGGRFQPKKHFTHLFSLKQKEGETNGELVQRWNEAINEVEPMDDKTSIALFMNVLRSGELFRKLDYDTPTSYKAMMARVNKFCATEESDRLKGKSEGAWHKGPDKEKKGEKTKAATLSIPTLKSLAAPVAEIESKEEGGQKRKRGDQKRRQWPYDPEKYCNFHRRPGHATEECHFLKKMEGEMKDKEPNANQEPNQGGNVWRRDAQPQQQVQENPEEFPQVRVIFGGPETGVTGKERKEWARKLYVGSIDIGQAAKKGRREPIVFSDEDLPFILSPHRTPLVISMAIHKFFVKRILVDTGSSVNVLYWEAAQQLGIRKEDLTNLNMPLSGFTGDIIEPEGSIKLDIIIGEHPKVRHMRMDFVVADIKCAHNAILGRPGLEDLGGALSLEHLCLKFRTPEGVGKVLGDQPAAKKAYLSACKKIDKENLNIQTIGHVLEDKEKKEEDRERPKPAVEMEEVVLFPEGDQEKAYLSSPPVLSKLLAGDVLFLYLGVAHLAVSSVLLREEERVQKPVYYTSRALRGPETRYTPLEKCVLAVVVTVKRLTPYFQAHPVRIMTNQPLGAVLKDPSSSGRVIKWAMVLSQYDISYQPRSSKKGQVIADFIVECTARGKPEEDGTGQERKRELWEVHSDGSCTKDGSGGGAVLTSPEGFKAYHSFKFMFRATNNEAEYEALIGGIQIALFMKIKHIHLKSDSKLAIGQLKGEMEAKEGRLKKYRDCAKTLLGQFESYELIYVPREENEEADMLAKLCRTIPIHMEGMVRQHERICPVWEEAVPVLEISGPGETPFALAYGFEAKVPTEVLVPSTMVETYTPSLNEQLVEVDSHFTQERRDDAAIKAEEYQRQSKRYHDKKVVLRVFEVGNWVLRKREKSQPTKGGKLAQNWEGPYRVEKVVRTGTYQLATSEGKALDNYWNVEHLKKFYQ